MDPLTLVMLAVLALLVFFMFRNGRKRQKDTLSLQSKMVPGADVTELPRIGHYPQVEAPEAVLAAYLQFRDRIGA